MPDFFQSTFMPHGYCLQWNGSLLATFVIGNALIAMAYFSIPTSLWWFQKKRTDLAFRWIFLLFATFISACGITHLVKIWTIWHADYWLEASLDAFTGIVSVITAFALWRILPLALQLPTPSQIAEDQNKIAQLEMQANQNAVILEQLSLAIACIKDYSIVLLDPNGAVMTWNDGAAGLQGYSSAEIIGKNVSAFYTPEDLEKGSPEHDLIRAIAAGQVQDTKHLVKKDGSTFLANVVITPVYKDGTLKGFSIVTRDITDIKRIEDEVRGLKEFYETVLSNLNDGVIVAESTGKFIYHNEMAARTNPKILQPVPIETWSETLGLHLPDMTTPFPHDELPLAKAFRGEKTTATEIYLKNETLESGRWLEVSGTPIRVPTASDLNCGVLVIRDITSRKDSEQKLKNVSDRLNTTNKELEAFAAAVAHDLQEPLRTMTGFLGLLESRQKDTLDEQSSLYIKIVVETSNRMRTLIRDLLSYTKLDNQPKPLEPVSTDKALEIALLHLRQSIEESGAKIERDTMPLLLIDHSQLSLIFQNLIGNAIKYRGESAPEVTIKASATDSECVISVKDNGIGFDTIHSDRIFSVFKRLHAGEEYPGTGIGLAVCRRIVQRHGGKIWAESEVGKGSVFHFSIPHFEHNRES